MLLSFTPAIITLLKFHDSSLYIEVPIFVVGVEVLVSVTGLTSRFFVLESPLGNNGLKILLTK